MTLEDMKSIYDRISKERQELLPEYLKVMNKYFPEKMCSPRERFERDGGKYGIHKYKDCPATEEEMEEEWQEYLKHPEIYNRNYLNDFRDPQNASFSELFTYEMLYGKDKIPESEFIRHFQSVMEIYSIARDVIEDKYDTYSYTGRIRDSFLDSKILEFNNDDIIITDPCYILKNDNQDDWSKCNCGFDFEVLGITKYDTRSTLYGDWSCTVWNSDRKEEIGEFCADAGLVSIICLEEVRKYNPDIEKWCNAHQWCATIIRNFSGSAAIKTGFHDENGFYEFYRYVEGKGSVNFYGAQTGL